jgi:glutaminyl-peptide cyclotransferase
VLAALLAVPILGGTSAMAAPAVCAAPKAMTFQIDHRFNRDVKGFTEGLEVHNHDLYESTGALGGGTRLIRITPQGHATVLNNQGDKYFGEGLTFLGDRLYQLTWQDHLVFVYDKDFKLIRTMQNPHDGWGMTNDGHYLIYGDGSDHLYFVDPKDFAIKNSIQVRLGAQAVNNINELEDVGGKIYANIWMTKNIVRINARTGCIEAVAKLDTLWDHMTPPELGYTASDSDYVLNGIAYDPATRLFTLMGKEWPMAFVGRFQDQ